jgi:hypothetical protein
MLDAREASDVTFPFNLPHMFMDLSRTLLALALVCALAPPARSYSVLTHEAIIDTSWEKSIRPLLIKRFPDSTPDDLIKAHAYAYGGAIIQDMGYYPFGSKLFSDLVHYVRSGDFVLALLRDSQSLNDYAFALGALAHYSSDNEGHPIAVNRVVPMLYPKLRAKFGNEVTYEDDPGAHLKTEFGFDVSEIAQGHYAPQAYHAFIGFEVAKPLLEQAFEETYSVKLKDIFASEDLALGTYRHTVSAVIPEMTKAAWAAKKDEIVKAQPGMTKRQFVYNLSRASYHKEWGAEYERPGIGARFLAFLFRILPKIGPLKAFAFRPPGTEGLKLFETSFNSTLDHYRQYTADWGAGKLQLPNRNFDTGRLPAEGAYKKMDQTYVKLLEKLSDKDKKDIVSPELRANILAFYRNPEEILSPKARAEFQALQASGQQPASQGAVNARP